MAKPTVASSIRPLPENMMTPPRMPEELRTGWEVKPGDPAELAKAIEAALALEPDDYARALCAGALQFAGYTLFAEQSRGRGAANLCVAAGIAGLE